jgi:hypothetical protein
MDHKTGEDAPPSTDLAGWRRSVGDGCFRAFRMESVIAAIQDLGPTTDKAVMNPLVLHVSETITRVALGTQDVLEELLTSAPWQADRRS